MQEFPPKSSLDPSKFGDHTSTITAAHIEKNLEGLNVQQVITYTGRPTHRDPL